jgi:hypothetical protein
MMYKKHFVVKTTRQAGKPEEQPIATRYCYATLYGSAKLKK